MAEDSAQPPHATRFVETTRASCPARNLALLPVERVLRVQQDIEDALFAARPPDESLLLAECFDRSRRLRLLVTNGRGTWNNRACLKS